MVKMEAERKRLGTATGYAATAHQDPLAYSANSALLRIILGAQAQQNCEEQSRMRDRHAPETGKRRMPVLPRTSRLGSHARKPAQAFVSRAQHAVRTLGRCRILRRPCERMNTLTLLQRNGFVTTTVDVSPRGYVTVHSIVHHQGTGRCHGKHSMLCRKEERLSSRTREENVRRRSRGHCDHFHVGDACIIARHPYT
jgi:hypothetical protein